jgi:N utilization substance protein A
VSFATHALSPAKVSRITILDPVEKHMEVIVDDSQLSLAIGKKGQNVRLAAKLLGWKNRHQERGREAAGSGIADGRAGGAGRAGFRACWRRCWRPASAPSRSWAA